MHDGLTIDTAKVMVGHHNLECVPKKVLLIQCLQVSKNNIDDDG